MLGLILSSALELLEASGGAVVLLDQSERMHVRASAGLTERDLARLHPALDGALRAQIVAPEEIEFDIAVPGEAGEEARLWRVIAQPLPGQAPAKGVLYALREFGRPAFQRRDHHLLAVLARQVVSTFERAQAQAALTAERARLQDMQNTFVSIVSHELQTPVAIIKGYAGTLRRADVTWSPSVVQRVAATIEAECDRLTRLITDLLDLARIQAGRVAMTFGPTDLAELVLEVVEQARPRAPRHLIVTEQIEQLPVLRADHDKLRMALNNLVDNAIKYSPDGGTITVGGRVEPDRVLLWVRDEGIGIPLEEQERIFERFHRVDTRLSRETPGVGMGLYICKVIVEAHNGRVWVESAGPGRGSTFYIALPRTTGTTV